ncbi:MAG TPA: class I SAM-dependent methyltransferase [Clostridia bacterium]|nr:class I SAM-dependent methyltransferase [Clostridia bacterium]
MNDYQRCISFWDSIFLDENSAVPQNSSSGNTALDDAIGWLSKDSECILDFGCGNGSLLFYCSLHGTKSHLGIDLSKQAIITAQRRTANMPCGDFEFRQGGLEILTDVPDMSYDAVILSNIIDNLYPDDAMKLLHACVRILKEYGKIFVKLNPYITQEQIIDWKIKTISGNLLDDGLLLWNQTTEQWRVLFQEHFSIIQENEIYYPEHDQTNRVFHLMKY